jgi:shikimate kinase
LRSNSGKPDKEVRSNLVLVGLMGAGKTTVGKALARKTGWRFVDTDHEIELRTGVGIPVIFDIEGEQGFRQREARAVAEILADERIIAATGGGAVLLRENRDLMRKRGIVCYLKATPRTLFQRTRGDRTRPLLQVPDPMSRLADLLDARGPLYEEVADIVIDVEKFGTAQIVERLSQLEIFRCQSSA